MTKTCNLQCRHCYMSSVLGEDKGELSKEDWFRFFVDLKEAYGTSINLVFSGGEILLKKDIFEILEFVKRLGFDDLGIVSNGLLLTKKNIKRLKKLINTIGISLDGFENEHNYFRCGKVYDKTIENIKMLKQISEIKVVVKTTVFKDNCEYLDIFYHYLKELGVDFWHFYPMEPIGRGMKNMSDLMSFKQYEKVCLFADSIRDDKELSAMFQEQKTDIVKTRDYFKVKKCGAGYNFFSILSNGDVTKCFHSSYYDVKGVFGNICTDSIKEIWETKLLNSIGEGKEYCIKPYYVSEMKKRYG